MSQTKGFTLMIQGAILAFFGVALGAFGAHAMKEKVTPDQLAIYQTGVQYHMYHAIGLIACGLFALWLASQARAAGGNDSGSATSAALRSAHNHVTRAGVAMLVGVVLFSGSLYVLVGTGVKMLGMITPFGGVSFLFGWLSLVLAAWQARRVFIR